MSRTKLAALTLTTAAIVAAAVLVVSQAAGEEQITGSEAARVGVAALEATGGGQVLSIERSDDAGEEWEVEVRRGSSEVDVGLDGALDPIGSESELRDEPEEEEGDVGGPGADDVRDPGGRERRSVAEAALRHVGGGAVESVERSDDPGEAYEVEIVRRGREVDVALDRSLRPVPNVRYDDD